MIHACQGSEIILMFFYYISKSNEIILMLWPDWRKTLRLWCLVLAIKYMLLCLGTWQWNGFVCSGDKGSTFLLSSIIGWVIVQMASVSSQPQFRYTQPPSKVLHLRNLPWECTEEELIELGKPFGKVVNTKCNVGANRNQAFIEFVSACIS